MKDHPGVSGNTRRQATKNISKDSRNTTQPGKI